MFRSKTYKEKTKLLLVVSLLFGIIVYGVALDKTISLYQQNRFYQAQLDSAQTAPKNIARLTRELNSYENSLVPFSTNEGSREERLLQEVASVCQKYHARLIQLPPANKEEQKLYTIGTRALKLDGSYTSLVQVVHALESRKTIGRISSVYFALEEDRRTRSASLFAYIYLQNIQKSENLKNEN